MKNHRKNENQNKKRKKHIHLCDMFYFLENIDITSYADDNTLYSAQKNRETVINTIETWSQVLFDWFSDNFMKANSGKSHLLAQ